MLQQTGEKEAEMRVTSLVLVLLPIFAVDGMVPAPREAGSEGAGEAQVVEKAEKYEALQANGAPQYTAIWVLPSLGGF